MHGIVTERNAINPVLVFSFVKIKLLNSNGIAVSVAFWQFGRHLSRGSKEIETVTVLDLLP